MSSENWTDLYKKKLCKAEDAALAVKSGDRIMNPLCLGQPTNLIMDAIADRKDEVKDCEFNALLTLRPYKMFKPEYRGSFRINAGFLGTPSIRSCFPVNRRSFMPSSGVETWPALSAKAGPWDCSNNCPLSVFLIMTS